TFDADALVDALFAFEPGVSWNGKRVFWPRAEAAGRAIAAALTGRGAVIDEAVAYRTVLAADAGPALAAACANADAVVLASGSAARAMVALAADPAAWARIPIVCIGPVTARAARDVGLSPAAVAAKATTAGIVDALRDALRRQE
ncbi:MAG: hypothetical protein FJX78_10275, partial [Armatimonadetes bacterium]|nr:hypothetical protein [Armatimonadota bacterium]